MGNCEVNSTLSPSLLCNEEECLLLLVSQEKRLSFHWEKSKCRGKPRFANLTSAHPIPCRGPHGHRVTGTGQTHGGIPQQ